MSETISFRKTSKEKSLSMQKRLPSAAVLKYCLNEELPTSEDKNVLIYTLDKDELWHGNGQGFPLSKVTYGNTETKDVVFVSYDVESGPQMPEIVFPYFGTLEEITLAIPSDRPLTDRLLVDIEVLRNGVWLQVIRLCLDKGKTTLTQPISFKLNNEQLRYNVISKPIDHMPSMVGYMKISL